MKKIYLFLCVSWVFVPCCFRDDKPCTMLAKHEATGITPLRGYYSVNTASAEFLPKDYRNPLIPLSRYGLVVMVNGEMDVTSNGFRHDVLDMRDGSFSFIHGDGADDTICPNDGYAISGHFISESEAIGKFISYPNCYCGTVEDFVAKFEYEPK